MQRLSTLPVLFYLAPFIFQGYLKEFNEFHEDLKGKKVGLFGVSADSQEKVDQAMKDWELTFTVRKE